MTENIAIQKTKTYRFVLWKSYFDKGYSWLSFPKYIFLLFLGADTLLTGGNNKWTLIIAGIIFFIVCFILGRVLFLKRFTEAEFEVGNVFNPFVKEMRDYIQ